MIPFGEWRPDMPVVSKYAREAKNVIPLEESYGPFPSFSALSDALPAACRGAGWFRAPGNVVRSFAATETALYEVAGSAWTDVTRTSGGAYAAGPDGMWRFAQYGTLGIAVNGVDTPQKIALDSGTAWEALGGTPPVGTYVAVVRDFLVMGRIGDTHMRVQWSGMNNGEVWGSVPASQADYQDLPDGGNITGLVGGEVGIILQEAAVRRMSYEGSPVVFRIDKIANDVGATVPGSVAGVLDMVFFLHKSGFYMVQGGQQLVPIGRGKVDRTFWDEFDEAKQFNTSAAVDPVRGLYVFAYPVLGGTGACTKLLIYNWRTGFWSWALVTTEIVYGGAAQQGYTLEGLDAVGVLETLPYSLDSTYWTGTISLRLHAFNSSHVMGAFSGLSLEATIETPEFQPAPGRMAVVYGLRVLVDGSESPTVELGARSSQVSSPTYGSSVPITRTGMSPVRGSGRFFRVRTTIPVPGFIEEQWTDAIGIDDLMIRPAGQQ
jgi:hypothetical protein